MSVIGDEVAAVVGALQEAGVPATDDPATLVALTAAHPAAALIDRPTDVRIPPLSGARMDFLLIVWLCARGPDRVAQDRLLPALPTALRVLRPREVVTADRWSAGDVELAAYRIESPRVVSLTGLRS